MCLCSAVLCYAFALFCCGVPELCYVVSCVMCVSVVFCVFVCLCVCCVFVVVLFLVCFRVFGFLFV